MTTVWLATISTTSRVFSDETRAKAYVESQRQKELSERLVYLKCMYLEPSADSYLEVKHNSGDRYMCSTRGVFFIAKKEHVDNFVRMLLALNEDSTLESTGLEDLFDSTNGFGLPFKHSVTALIVDEE